MITLSSTPPLADRPTGVTLIAALALGTAFASATMAVLNIIGAVPLATGASLIGGGLEILGPGIFAIYAILAAAAGVGLLRLNNWARRIAILILVVGLVQVTPAISMAVADGRIAAIIRSGLQIIVRTAALWYLFQEPVKEAFE